MVRCHTLIFLVSIANLACSGSSSKRQLVSAPVRYGPKNEAKRDPKYRDFAPILSKDGNKLAFLSYREGNEARLYKKDMSTDAAVQAALSGDEVSGRVKRAAISSDGTWLLAEKSDSKGSRVSFVDFAGTKTPASFAHPNADAVITDTVVSEDVEPIIFNLFLNDGEVEASIRSLSAAGQVSAASGLTAFADTERSFSFFNTYLASVPEQDTSSAKINMRSYTSLATLAAATPAVVSVSGLTLFSDRKLSGSATEVYASIDISSRNLEVEKETDKIDIPADQKIKHLVKERVVPITIANSSAGTELGATLIMKVEGQVNTTGDLVVLEGIDSFDCKDIDGGRQRGLNIMVYDKTANRATRVLLRQADTDVSTYEVTSKTCNFLVDATTGKTPEYNRNISELTVARASTRDNVTMAFTLSDRIGERYDYEVYWLRFGLDADGAITNPVLKNVSNNRSP